MKVDTSRLKKGTSEVPPECQNLIDKLKCCNRFELIEELSQIEAWTFGKCELYHWIDILDIFDEILEDATRYEDNQIYIHCDAPSFDKGRKLLLLVLNFTTLLIEHSFSRHLYNSVEYLTQLLLSTDLEIILGVLNLLYMFSKRSNFISRLSCHKKNTLLSRLKHIAEPYGGKECGFGLADCCRPDQQMPKEIYHFYYEYYTKNGTLEVIDYQNISKHDPKTITLKFWQELDSFLDDDQKYHLFARARLATGFWNYENRILFVQARLQALSILVYSDALLGYTSTLIYPGFLEELVELLELQQPNLVEIRAAALRTLTAIIHLERNSQYQRKSESRLNTIIEVTGAASYHGFLPTLVRNCIANLTGMPNNNVKTTVDQHSLTSEENLFPLQLATALFSFLYHLASYEPGAESLVSCGMMESLLRVINWSGTELEHITFVTRAVRVIDLITNLDMQSFQLNNGLNTFIKRLNLEVNLCRKEQSYEIKPNIEDADKNLTHMDETMDTGSQYGDDDIIMTSSTQSLGGISNTSKTAEVSPSSLSSNSNNRTCLPQRAALLKSMLNFLKKAIQDSAFSDSIRHIMEGTLPESLKHIISNSEYYGPSLFLLATDVVTVYVFQEPSLLSSLQDNGLTDVVLQALLKKDVPATREVLGSLPNVFSALCLNTRGLESFVKYNPFEKLFRVLTSPVYLSAMRRRRSSDPMGDTASNIGNAMDELMRNQPSLKTPAIKAIIKLLEEIVELGTDPKYICWRAQNKNDVSPQMPNSRQNNNNNNDNGGSSDEDEDDEEEVSTSSHNNQTNTGTATSNTQTQAASSSSSSSTTNSATQAVTSPSASERIPTALIDYTLNTMKFLEAILSNNSTDDHCREFVTLGGLRPLLSILSLPNFPVTSCNSPITATAQAVASVCKSILNLTHEPSVLQVALEQLSTVVEQLQPLQNHMEHTSSSVLLKELANCQDINHAFTNATYTPLLHAMSAVHGYVVMLVYVCRSGQSDIRTLSLLKWGQDNTYGMKLLKKLVMLYTGLVWESTLLLALCTDDIIPPGSEFGKDEMEKLGASDLKNIIEVNWDEIVSNLSVMENLTTNPNLTSSGSGNMDIDGGGGSSGGSLSLRKVKQSQDTSVRFVASQSQLKYIKSLLGASSRLGRALAELFGLLVRLCVGSPLRQRRGQNFPQVPSFTSPASRDIARILSFILVDGLSFSKLPASPVPKLKLTFLICSIGFTSPMLFDEKRYAYHLMLQKFIEEGGLDAFFEMFRWTLTAGYTIPIHRAIEHPNLPDGTGEALDAWLMLLEKMVNIRSIIESPHLITSKSFANRTVKQEFDSKHYLTYMHRHAFNSIQYLWGFKPLKLYGLRMTESMLSILKHIIKGEKVLQLRYLKNIVPAGSLTPAGSSTPAGSTTPAAGPSSSRANSNSLDMDEVLFLRRLMDMGFTREHSMEALSHSFTIEQATEYLLLNPLTQLDPISDEEPSAVAPSTVAPPNVPAPMNMDIDAVEEDEQVIRAILNSLGEALKSAEKVKNSETKNKQKESIKKYMLEQPLQQKTLDDFTQNLLKTCLNILDQLPETVYKICDLLTSVTKRNGPIWRDEMLDTLCKEIYQCIQYLIQVLVQDDERSSKNYKEKSDKLVSGEMANKTAVRIHLFTLFFQGQYQEMKLPCAIALKIYTIIPRLIKVLTDYQMIVSLMNKVLPTPKWLAPLALLLDLYDKVALSTKHKQVMHKISTRTWQSYNMVSYKWSNYTPEQNKLINDAYMSGESEVRLILGGRFQRCTINFNCMTQINDDETNRPIIMALRSIEAMNNPNVSLDEKAEDEAAAEAKNYVRMLENIELEPLASFVPEEIVSSCVQLMSHQQLDRDTLHAIMRVVVRLTKNYNMAEVFARFGGIDVLLNMKHNSGYIGFTTLATLLIRHVIEEPKTLSLAIQNVLANRTLTTIPAGHRDLLFLIRQLNSAVYRDPELFKEAALKILRVDFDSMKRSQIDEKRFIMKSVPLPNNIKYNMEHSTAMSAVCKLLKALVEPDDTDSGASGMMWSAAAPTERASGSKEGNRKEKFTATPQPISTEDPKDKTGAMNDKPLLSKSAILKILAEAVRSYQTVALYITEHIYKTGLSSMITEDTTALSFILDKMFHINDANMDRECPAMAQNLISAIASSDVIQAQYTVVHEVKLALQRALNETETAEKHLHIEGLASLIPAMIENNVANNDSNQFFKVNNQPQLRQNIFYIMLEKGIITDIARAVQYLELGGPNTTATINHLLKPLEMLLRLTNEPMPTIPVKIKKALPQRRTPNVNAEDATHSDSTNAQDEQMLADDSEQNTERDMSSAAIDSLVGENELGDHIGEVHLNEILDTLISEELRGINDYADDGAADADDDADNEGEETEGERRHHRRHMHRDNGEMIVRETLESSSDSGDSSSNPSENDEREMDEVDEIENDEDEEEEEAEERSELDVDEETQPFEMYDHHHHMYGRHLSPSIPEIERDHEDILMIQYSNNGQNAAISNNNAASNVSQEPSTSAINSNAPPNNHPLLSGRPDGAPIANRHEGVHTNETAAVQVARRSQGRPRHYQFINISSRNQPVILQRMLELRQGRNHPPGGNAAQVQGTAQLHDGAGAAASAGPGFYRGDTTRVVVMDNGFSIFSNEDMEIEMVDQSTGYWFGRTLANHLNNLPSALCWWQEENKISGPDSNSDLCMMICEEMIPDLDAARASELSKIRGKRKKKPMEEEEGKQKNQDKKSNDDEETEEVRTQVVTVAPQVAVATTAVAGQSNQGISDSSSSSTSTNAEIIRRLRVEEFERRFTLCSESGSDDSNSNQAANNPVSSSNNLNISFMDVNEEEVTPITITTQTVSPPQHITTDNQLNIDLDVEMASDAEDSASANNSRSFSPNYSPNSNQIEANDMNMLNRATPSDNQQQQVVNNLNIQDNAQPPQLRSIRVPALEVDHPMRGDTDGDDSDDENERRSLLLENAANATYELEEEDDGNQEEGAVGGVSENQAAAEGGENDADVVVSIVNDNIDPAIRAILGDIEVPEGIDPSFLAALPAEMRNEVISEHTRQARIRQRAVQTAALQEAQAMADVNPEFLAALPLNIQEEVLAQQRLEQQRQAAATANPNDPVNTAEFFQNLQPSLRQAILTDMEDSQISALPPDLAAEAQNLRRDWETRNRQLLQERILHTSSFSNVIRHNNRSEYNSISRQLRSLQLDALNVLGRIADPRVYVPRHNLLQFSTSGGYALTRAQPPQTTINPSMERQGAPLLDQESLASILVLLFIDDPNISTLRLYRVIRNLCFHVPTRKWIIKSLLSIIMRCNEESMDQYLEPIANTTSGGSTTRSSKVTASTVRDEDDKVKWLKLRLDSALGGRANVFLKKLEKSLGSNINISNVPLTIHPKASPTVCRHTLELLIFLAKSFPSHFLPLRKNINTPNVVDVPNGQTNDVTDEPMPSTSQASMVKEKSFDFWDILLRLDNEIDERTKKGAATGNLKAISKQIKEFNEQDIKTFNESPFGQLIMMLAYDIIRKNSLLTDKLLRLLSLISIMLADNKYKNGSTNKTPAIVDTTSQSEEHLSLTVKVLTSKSCSEDGLEDATALLINLSQCSSKTKYMIINLLVEGVISLSHMVQKHINTLMIELKELNESMKGDKIKTETSIVGPSHDDTDNNDMMKPSSSKGQLKDRFTKESVIITAPSKVKTSCDLQLPSMAPLLSKTSNQSFFLRILKVITQIRDTIRQDSKTCDTDIEQQLHKLETVPLSELLNLDALWNTLSGCLKELEETQDHHAVLVLQPAVEAFFIVHSAPQVKTTPPTPPVAAAGLPAAAAASGNNQLDQAERTVASQNSQTTPAQPLSADQKKFLQFAETHRVVLNQILRQSSTHLADGPFAVLVDHTRVLDFDVKRRYFRIELERLDDGIRREELAVHVHRVNVFEDSFRELYRRNPEEWKNRFYIVFEDEEGQDAGGLLREWYMIISREIFNPMYALFCVSPGDRVTYMINTSSHCNPNHLCYFKFVGRVIAKAIYDNKLLECYFTRSFYKHILGIQVKYTDMESEDYEFYRGLVYLMENTVDTLGYDLTFSLEIQEFGVTEVRELIPNGGNIQVTEQNKLEYIQLVCQLKMSGSIKQQLNAFLEGFYDIIPKRLISIFNEQELELLISGLPNIDIEDLRANTEYHKYQVTSIQIQWFWRALRSFDQAERAKFLQFVTGTSKVPLQGFGSLEGMNGTQKFQIHRDDRSTDRLPSAHTCFNQLDLPVYKSYDKLRGNLLKAIHECSEGFGFA
ncbi:unnamed protein product [Diamesa hyperborea]